MVSVPRRFAGFQSAESVLKDASLSNEQKRTALLSWRASLQGSAPFARHSEDEKSRMIREIDAALRKLR